jgi:hypothetical protein
LEEGRGGSEVLTEGFALAKQALYCLSHTSSPFCSDYFGDGGLKTYLPGLASNHTLPISASQEARITDMNHRYLAFIPILSVSRTLIKSVRSLDIVL